MSARKLSFKSAQNHYTGAGQLGKMRGLSIFQTFLYNMWTILMFDVNMTKIAPSSDTPKGSSEMLSPKILLLTHHAARTTDILMIERKCGRAIKIVCTNVTDAIEEIGRKAIKGINLIFLEANLGCPGDTKTSITADMLRCLFRVFPGVHIRFFSAGTLVNISELMAALDEGESSCVSSGLGEANYGTLTTPAHLCSPAARRLSSGAPISKSPVGRSIGMAVPQAPDEAGLASGPPAVEVVTPARGAWGCCLFFRGAAPIAVAEPGVTYAVKA